MRLKNHDTKSKGFTLVELMVVLSIIGVLVALLLPAVQAAREVARRTHCKNNLKQISLAVLNHEYALGYFPYGGWGHEWLGVPGEGSKKNQPGGWVYNILPYLEQKALYQLGGDPNASNATELYSQRLSTPLCDFVCPTRRPCTTWDVVGSPAYLSNPKPAGSVQKVARGDYAINAGANCISSFPGPSNLEEGNSPTYAWPPNCPGGAEPTGISHLRYGATAKQIAGDGASNTYLIGEKLINPDEYSNGKSRGDNETLYSGYATDLHRFTRIDLVPLQDYSAQRHESDFLRFGSAHPSGFAIAFCDGSVRFVSFDISAEIHYQHGHRNDGQILLAN